MTPFLQFRIWLRRASAAQKVSGALSVAVLLALVVWTAVPSGHSASSVSVTGIPGSSAASGAAGTGPGGASSSAPAQAAAATSTTLATAAAGAAPGGAGTPATATAAGATPGAVVAGAGTASGNGQAAGASTSATQCTRRGSLRIGVVVPDAGGGSINSVIGAPPTSQEEADYAAVFDSVNKAGGVDCYNLVGDYATADLTNPSSANAGCLQFKQDHVFAVLGGFEPLFSDDCVLQAHIPTFDELPIPQAEAKQYYPYYFTDYPSYELLYKNFVDAANRMGYFGPAHHFAKMGIFYENCTPEINQALLTDLAAVGVSGPKVDTYNLGCSSAFASPAAVEQAVLKFKSDGVTTATIDDDIADGQNISNIANQQGFKPAWILPDYGEVAVQNSSSEHPNASEFDGAMAITAGQYGAIGSNLPETAATRQCDQVMTSHGLPAVYQSPDQFAGSTCGQVWMLVAALRHSGVNPTAIPAGLQAARSVDMPFPLGPNDFSVPGTTWGGEFWRPLNYSAACQCWKVTNPTWSPSFS
ncbi:MAG TPA: hypothetical protein VFH58_05245 [Acidimicrobiales bacterium]|nr:hypothetical protein [Acidimicrobiales bacterium]